MRQFPPTAAVVLMATVAWTGVTGGQVNHGDQGNQVKTAHLAVS